jgi:hypothetical protein
VFDSYKKSINNSEQLAGGQTKGSTYNITGSDQTPLKDFRYSLRSASFKRLFLNFLMHEWKDDKYASIMKKNFFCSFATGERHGLFSFYLFLMLATIFVFYYAYARIPGLQSPPSNNPETQLIARNMCTIKWASGSIGQEVVLLGATHHVYHTSEGSIAK